MEKERESWGSRFGFLMSAAGFSIGLGNMWRFPYLTGENGGGAFLFVYLVICALIGIPLFNMEMSLGRRTKKSVISGMQELEGKKSPWTLFGWFSVLASFVILTYYMQIMGWILIYLFKMVSGSMQGLGSAEYAVEFAKISSNTGLVALFTLACVILVGVISSKGLENGIEKACKILLPTLFVMLIFLAVRSLRLPGAMEGLKWYLKVDFSKINGKVILTALGQVFFSVGIASGGAFTYGSYLADDSDIPTDSLYIILFDVLAAFIAGIVMFPAIFALGLKPDSGSSLLFITMSNLFNQLPAGQFFGGLFFLLIFFAALSSALGYLEPIAVSFVELKGMDRKKAVWVSLILIFIVGFPTIMAHGSWSEVKILGKNFFDFADFLSGNILMPLGALILSLYTAKVWKFEGFRDYTNQGAEKLKIYDGEKLLINYVVPVSLLIIFVTGLI